MSSRVSKFTYRSFIHITYNSSNPDHRYRSQIAFTSATGARPLHGSFNVNIPRVVCSLSSRGLLLKKNYLWNTQVSDDGILLLGYRFCGWFTSSYCFCLVLPWKRRTPMWADVDTSESPLTIIYLSSFSIQVPEQRKTML